MQDESDDDDELFEQNIYQTKDENTNIGNESNESSESSEDDVVYNDIEFDEYKISNREKEDPNYPMFNLSLIYNLVFNIGMIFISKAEFKKTVQFNAIKTKRSLKFTKNDKMRVYVTCQKVDCQ